LGADQVTGAKPRPDGLLQCCQVLGVSPKDTVYVGDSPSDGQAAAAAGMPSIGVSKLMHLMHLIHILLRSTYNLLYVCTLQVTWGSHPAENVRNAFTYTVTSVQELQETILQVLSTAVETGTNKE
jgi:phosphoglycolate phosphatase-like HAD superfamily hydrolase